MLLAKLFYESLIILQNPVSFAMFEQKFATVPVKIPHFAETGRAEEPLSYMLEPEGNQYLKYLNPPKTFFVHNLSNAHLQSSP